MSESSSLLPPVTDDLRPMKSFDPTKRVLVYDELNDKIFEWNPKDWAGAYATYAKTHDKKRGVIEWDGLLLAGWKELPDAVEGDLAPASLSQ